MRGLSGGLGDTPPAKSPTLTLLKLPGEERERRNRDRQELPLYYRKEVAEQTALAILYGMLVICYSNYMCDYLP